VTLSKLLVIALIDVYAVAALLFRRIARVIRSPEDTGKRIDSRFNRHKADARAYRKASVLPYKAEILQGLAHLMGDSAPVPVDSVQSGPRIRRRLSARPYPVAHLRARMPPTWRNTLVPYDVPARVVDDLELIEIQVDDSVWFLWPRCGKDALQLALELPTIGEPRQRIMGGVIAQLARRLACLGNVAKDQHGSNRRALVVLDHGRRIVD
jgi:hypothetical protein